MGGMWAGGKTVRKVGAKTESDGDSRREGDREIEVEDVAIAPVTEIGEVPAVAADA